MNAKKISLIVVGMIWLLVGIGLSLAGTNWITKLGFGPTMFIFLTSAVTVGFLKGKFILGKVALKYYKRSEVIEFNKHDIFTGWAKIFGVKGFILISLMMIMGSILRRSPIDRPILGIIYLAVGIALLYASKIFFNDTK